MGCTVTVYFYTSIELKWESTEILETYSKAGRVNTHSEFFHQIADLGNKVNDENGNSRTHIFWNKYLQKREVKRN